MDNSTYIIINRNLKIVWEFFTTKENWQKWWGGTLQNVNPGWQIGARLQWGNGDSSTIANLIQQEEFQMASTWMLTVFKFTGMENGNTKIEVEFSPRGGATFSDGGSAHKTQLSSALNKIKQYIENIPKGVDEPATNTSVGAPVTTPVDATTVESLIATLKGINEGRSSNGTLSSSQETLSDSIVLAIVQIGKPSVEALIALVNDGIEKERKLPRGTQIRGRDTFLFSAAAKALGQIGDARAVEPLIPALYSLTYMSGQALDALMQIGDVRAVTSIVDSARNKSGHVYQNWIKALVKFGPPAVDQLVRGLKSQWPMVRGAATEALMQIGDSRATAALIENLMDTDEGIKIATIKALGKIGGADSVMPLCAALKDDALKVREATIKALGEIGDRRAVKPLLITLKDPVWYVRREAAEALGKIGDAQSVQPLRGLLNDSDEYVRKAVTNALKSITSTEADVQPKTQPLDAPQPAAKSLPKKKWWQFGSK